MLLLEFLVLLPQGVDSINHGLDKLHLRVAKTMLVGDVVGVTLILNSFCKLITDYNSLNLLLTSLAAGLSLGATGLNLELLAPGLELVDGLGGPSGEVHVDRGPHACAQVGGAGVDVSVLLRKRIILARLGLNSSTNLLDSLGQAGEDTLDISSLLHGDDAGLVLLVDPHEEGLGVIVEDSTALGPVTLHASDSQISVTIDEEEVVIHKLLSDLLVHASEGVVGASQVTSQVLKSLGEHFLEVYSLLLGDSGRQAESINIATNTDTGGVDGHISLDVALDLGGVHVGGVLGIGGDAVVVLDDSIEDLREVLVGVPVSGVDAAVLVVELNGASTSLGDGEVAGLGLDVLDLVPSLLGHVLGDQGVLGLDVGEFSGHFEC